MLSVTNISITERADLALDVSRLTSRLRPGDSFALVYMKFFTEPDGTAVEGFVPGYSIAAFPDDSADTSWAMAQFPNGMAIRIDLRFTWDADARYVLDLTTAGTRLTR